MAARVAVAPRTAGAALLQANASSGPPAWKNFVGRAHRRRAAIYYISDVSDFSVQSFWGGTSFVGPQLHGVTSQGC